MKNVLLKNILLVFSGVLLTLIILGGAFLYLKEAFSGFEWSIETRIMLYEELSPNKEYKFGAYHYDIGAFGYSAVQASVVKSDEEFPINGNMLSGKPIKSANWVSDEIIEIVSPTTSEIKPKFVLQVKHE